MWIPFAFWPSFIATVISGVLVYFVVIAGIKKPGNMAAFVMFVSMLIWSFGEMIERIAGPPPADESLAYAGAILLCFGIFLLPAGIIHFAFDYPFRFRIKPEVRKGVLYSVYGVSFAAMIANLFN